MTEGRDIDALARDIGRMATALSAHQSANLEAIARDEAPPCGHCTQDVSPFRADTVILTGLECIVYHAPCHQFIEQYGWYAQYGDMSEAELDREAKRMAVEYGREQGDPWTALAEMADELPYDEMLGIFKLEDAKEMFVKGRRLEPGK